MNRRSIPLGHRVWQARPAAGRRTAGVIVAVTMLSAMALAGTARASLPSLPGPPPDDGVQLPAAPAPASSPAAVAAAPTVEVPTSGSSFGLRSGFVQVNADTAVIKLACSARTTATLKDGSVTLAATAACHGGTAQLHYRLTTAQARVVLAGGDTVATITRKGAGAEPLPVQLSSAAPAPAFWTSTFGLDCTASGTDSALLTAPNFTVTPATTIDVRPWLAYYTPRSGWQWLGLSGPSKSAWLRWTATSNGVFEWQTSGTIIPWTWGPIQVTPGQATQVVAAFEVVYWYSHPVDVWRYAYAQPGLSASACAFS